MALSYKCISLVVPEQNIVIVIASIEYVLGSAGYTAGLIHTVEDARWESNWSPSSQCLWSSERTNASLQIVHAKYPYNFITHIGTFWRGTCAIHRFCFTQWSFLAREHFVSLKFFLIHCFLVLEVPYLQPKCGQHMFSEKLLQVLSSDLGRHATGKRKKTRSVMLSNAD